MAADAVLETTIVTATRNPSELSASGVSIRAIGEDEVKAIKAVHISELLGRSPGTWINRGNGQEHLTAIRSPVFTGSGSCGAFYMAEDNVPLRPVGFCNVNQLSETLFELAERVEVLRGPGTAVHGSNAQHGVINVISPDTSVDSSRLSLEGGPHGYARGTGSINFVNSDDSAARLDLSVTHDDGWKDESGFDQIKAAFAWQGSLNEAAVKTRLMYGKLDQETAGYIQGKDAYKDGELREQNPNPEAYRDNEYLRWYARFDFEGADGSTWSFTPFARYQEMEFLMHFLVGQPLEENGSVSAGWQSEWQPAMNGPVQLSLGLDGEWADGFLKQTQAQEIGFSPVFPSGKHYDYDVESVDLAAFAHADWQISDALSVSGGVRAERLEYEYDNAMIDGATKDDGTPCGSVSKPIACRYSRPSDRSDDFNELSWNLSAQWAVSDSQTLIAGLARGFRPPQAAELYRLQAGQVVADIDAEAADSVELGWRGSVDALSYQLVGFYMDKEDTIYQDSQRRNVTGADTEHYGVEYSLQLQLGEQWQLLADGSWARHRYTNNPDANSLVDGNDMDTAPRMVTSTRLAWTPNERISTELEWSHVDKYYLTDGEAQEYEGHDLLHLRLRHQISESLFYGVRMTNLTDEEYAERADYAFGSYRYFVGEPRGIYLEFGWQR